MTWNLAQTMSIIKAAQHKYTHRKMIGRDPKTNRIRYRYYYAEHHGGGITSANIEEGSAFKLTFKGRRGHFHVQRVEGDRVFVKHDGRPNAKEVVMTKSELRALLKRQHETIENKKREKAQEARRKGRKKPAKKTQAPREQMTETAKQGVDPTERGAESVSGLSDEDTKEMDAAVDRFRFTPEEIQNMSLDELSKIREAFGEVFIDHRNRLYETPEYQRLTQAHKEAWAAVPTNEDLRTTEAWAISDEIEALKERFRERHIAPLRELIKPIDERLERLQRNKRAREKRAEKKQRTQEQAARRARREEQARKKREGQARIDQTTARRMLAQDEARKMLGLARKYSATQPAETTQPTDQRSQTAQAFSGMVDAIKSGEGTQEAQRAFKAELTKVIDKTESGTLTDAERAELLPLAEQLIEATTGGPRELMTAIRDQIKGSSEGVNLRLIDNPQQAEGFHTDDARDVERDTIEGFKENPDAGRYGRIEMVFGYYLGQSESAVSGATTYAQLLGTIETAIYSKTTNDLEAAYAVVSAKKNLDLLRASRMFRGMDKELQRNLTNKTNEEIIREASTGIVNPVQSETQD